MVLEITPNQSPGLIGGLTQNMKGIFLLLLELSKKIGFSIKIIDLIYLIIIVSRLITNICPST